MEKESVRRDCKRVTREDRNEKVVLFPHDSVRKGGGKLSHIVLIFRGCNKVVNGEKLLNRSRRTELIPVQLRYFVLPRCPIFALEHQCRSVSGTGLSLEPSYDVSNMSWVRYRAVHVGSSSLPSFQGE